MKATFRTSSIALGTFLLSVPFQVQSCTPLISFEESDIPAQSVLDNNLLIPVIILLCYFFYLFFLSRLLFKENKKKYFLFFTNATILMILALWFLVGLDFALENKLVLKEFWPDCTNHFTGGYAYVHQFLEGLTLISSFVLLSSLWFIKKQPLSKKKLASRVGVSPSTKISSPLNFVWALARYFSY